MTDAIILAALSFGTGVVAIVTPVIKLNSNIVKLNTTMEIFEKNYNEAQVKINERVEYHGKQIDELEKKTIEHETRIKQMEKRGV